MKKFLNFVRFAKTTGNGKRKEKDRHHPAAGRRHGKICQPREPENCKRLLNALADNIRKYEAVHGTIELAEAEQPRTINLADIPTSGTKS